MRRSIDRFQEQKLGEAYVKRGGRMDRRKLFLGQEIGRRNPPVQSVASANRKRSLDPVQVFNYAEANDDKGPQEQPERDAREDRGDFRHRRTQGRLRSARGVFFPKVTPITWRTSALRIAFQS